MDTRKTIVQNQRLAASFRREAQITADQAKSLADQLKAKAQ
jgi:hypothetical protein